MIRHLRAAAAALLLLVLGAAAAHATANGAIGCTGVSTNFQNVTCPDINEELTNANNRGIIRLSSVSGTNTITANAAPYALTSYQDGQHFTFKPAAGNTGAVTLNINSLGAKAVVKQTGSALASSDLLTTTIYTIQYYASDDHFRVMGPVGAVGTDDDVPEASDYTNLTGGTGIVNSPTGTIAFDFSDAGANPSLGSDECRFTSNATVAGYIVCEGDTANGIETRIAVTNPTSTDKTFLIPDADSYPIVDKDYGDITVSASGQTWNVDAGAIAVATDISGLGTGIATWLATPSSANLAAAITDETGSGANVFATSPTLVTPNLGTPSAVTLTNGTGLPISTGVSGLGANVATFLGTASSANLRSAMSDELGTGVLFFLGAPAADDQVFVSSSTSAGAWGSIPDSDGATQKLQYDVTTNTFSAGTDDDIPDAGDFTNLALTGDVTSSGLATTIAANAVALTTDTTGNYMADIAAGTGIAVTHTPAEGSTGTVAFSYTDKGASPSLNADECVFSGDATTNGELVCEGDTADAFETRIVITDPTADRAMTIPNADSNPVQPSTCSGSDKVTGISSAGVISCGADAGAGGGISNVVEDLTPELGGPLDTNGKAIEFGTAQTDTSMVRSSAGNVSIEGVEVTTASNTQTLTNKSIAADQITAGTLNIGNNAATVGTIELANGTANTLSASGGVLSIEGAALATAASVTNKPESFCFAMSDESTDLTAGTNKIKFRMPYAFTVTAVRASLSTAATGANLLTVDLNEGGSTILSTKLTFDASETTTTTAATAAVISDNALADDAEISGDVDQIGNTTAGRGLKVCMIGHQ